ncbi:hypothetical protein GEMRC1_002745 [Eukaryota sp. GEM-RC1]
MINGIPVQGFWDSGATMSVITQDLAMKCNMTPVNENVRFTSANNVESRSLGSAQGILTVDTSSIAYLTHVDKTLPIIPGSNKLLLGIDLMKQLGLLIEDGLVIRIDKAILATVNDASEFDSRIIQPPRSHSIDNIVDFNKHVFDSGCTIKLDDDNRAKSLLSLLQEFSSIFSTAPHKDGIDCPPMAIDFDNEESTVRRKPRRLNPMKQRIAEEIFDELVRQDFAELTTPNGQFSSPVVLVVYPDQRKPRLTGDFSGSYGINALTRVVEPNLPKIINILEFLSEANFIATLDLPKAFWQLNLAEKDRDKTTRVIPGKAIRFKRACYGLKNVPVIFQNLMYEIFDHEGIFIYIDDIIIVGRTFEEFMSRIRFVLTKAFTRRVNLGLPKCHFVTKKHPLKILGSKFVNNTRSIDPSRITALLELPVPTTIKEVRSFVGSINYIKDFIPGASDLLAPIINLVKNNARSVKWTPLHQSNFGTIRNKIINHMPLSLPDRDQRVLISANASDIAVGGVIWQEIPTNAQDGTPLNNRKVIPLAFYSKLLTESQQNWATIQKELYAIVLILTESPMSSFLLSRDLTIFTDHRNLAFLISAPEKNRVDTYPKRIPIFGDPHVGAGHPSLRVSIDQLNSSDYFWPKMAKDMKKPCMQCPACQKTAPLAKLKIKPSVNLWADKPFAKMNADTIGPLLTDTSGNCHLLVFIDSFTRYTVLCPLKELNAQETAHALVCNVCAIFGIPHLIHSDNGK